MNRDRTSLLYYRKAGEGIEIGDSTVTVVKTGANRIRLRIQAPRDVRVVRTETAGSKEIGDAEP